MFVVFARISYKGDGGNAKQKSVYNTLSSVKILVRIALELCVYMEK
jgi:hypothetical protein